jgi:hypothetical protein
MRKINRTAVLVAAVVAVLAVAATALAAGPGQVVKVKTTLTISGYGYKGFVKATNTNCVGERKIVLKQKGRGVISHATSEANGRWEADLVELNKKIKTPAEVYAEAKPITQATAGPIYKCLAATSKTVEIKGG